MTVSLLTPGHDWVRLLPQAEREAALAEMEAEDRVELARLLAEFDGVDLNLIREHEEQYVRMQQARIKVLRARIEPGL